MEQDGAWWKLDLDQVEEGLLRLGWVEKLLDRKKRWHRWSSVVGSGPYNKAVEYSRLLLSYTLTT